MPGFLHGRFDIPLPLSASVLAFFGSLDPACGDCCGAELELSGPLRIGEVEP